MKTSCTNSQNRVFVKEATLVLLLKMIEALRVDRNSQTMLETVHGSIVSSRLGRILQICRLVAASSTKGDLLSTYVEPVHLATCFVRESMFYIVCQQF